MARLSEQWFDLVSWHRSWHRDLDGTDFRAMARWEAIREKLRRGDRAEVDAERTDGGRWEGGDRHGTPEKEGLGTLKPVARHALRPWHGGAGGTARSLRPTREEDGRRAWNGDRHTGRRENGTARLGPSRAVPWEMAATGGEDRWHGERKGGRGQRRRVTDLRTVASSGGGRDDRHGLDEVDPARFKPCRSEIGKRRADGLLRLREGGDGRWRTGGRRADGGSSVAGRQWRRRPWRKGAHGKPNGLRPFGEEDDDLCFEMCAAPITVLS